MRGTREPGSPCLHGARARCAMRHTGRVRAPPSRGARLPVGRAAGLQLGHQLQQALLLLGRPRAQARAVARHRTAALRRHAARVPEAGPPGRQALQLAPAAAAAAAAAALRALPRAPWRPAGTCQQPACSSAMRAIDEQVPAGRGVRATRGQGPHMRSGRPRSSAPPTASAPGRTPWRPPRSRCCCRSPRARPPRRSRRPPCARLRGRAVSAPPADRQARRQRQRAVQPARACAGVARTKQADGLQQRGHGAAAARVGARARGPQGGRGRA